MKNIIIPHTSHIYKFLAFMMACILFLALSFGLSVSSVGAHGDHDLVECDGKIKPAPDSIIEDDDGNDVTQYEHTCEVADDDDDDGSGSNTGNVNSASKTAACEGAQLVLPGEGCDPKKGDDAGTDIQETIQTVLNIFSWIVGIASVIMIIYAGFKYVISQGGEGTAQARNTILYAVVGLVVVALAQAIVRFVIGRV